MTGLLLWSGLAIAAILAFLLVQLIWLSVVMYREDQNTRGLGYYGLPPAERQRVKERLTTQARLLRPILRVLGRVSSFTFEKASFRHRGVAGPKGTCSAESFASVEEYAARAEDVFVVTQMKCGTTWMQHVVYQVLTRGDGDLVGSGTALYAVSPWLEGLKSVPVADAPLVGEERPARIIKTHLPVELCPWIDDARYIYVARHPVSCFASCVDFIATNAGAMAPDLAIVEKWFCSDAMWWGSWPAHVSGWAARAAAHDNVLFLTFEEMKRDLPAIVRRVAAFLGVAPLTEAEIGRVVEKCSFAYMQRHQEAFEMHPPHILQTDAELFVRGSADRHADVPEETRQRIVDWCRRELAGSGTAIEDAYPDLAPSRV